MAARSHGPILDNPGWVAGIFTVLVVAGFLGLLFQSASHHEGGESHGGGEHAAPAGSAAEHH
ncbi:MAG: hypothetical protein ACXVEF_40580 [Polyangiales bacterium]